jgi:hypothetical protein
VTTTEGQALQREGNKPVAWSGLQTELRNKRLGEMRTSSQAQQSTAAVRLYAFPLPSLPLDERNLSRNLNSSELKLNHDHLDKPPVAGIALPQSYKLKGRRE